MKLFTFLFCFCAFLVSGVAAATYQQTTPSYGAVATFTVNELGSYEAFGTLAGGTVNTGAVRYTAVIILHSVHANNSMASISSDIVADVSTWFGIQAQPVSGLLSAGWYWVERYVYYTENNSGVSGYHSQQNDWFEISADETQYVSSSFPSEVVQGRSYVGYATGAHTGNAYNISVVSGSGSASINSATGQYTVQGTVAGGLTFKIWASAGDGFSRSPDALFDSIVKASRKVLVKIPANTSGFPVEYTLKQGSNVLGVVTQPVGAVSYILTKYVEESLGEVTLTSRALGVGQSSDGLLWTSNATDSLPTSTDGVTLIPYEDTVTLPFEPNPLSPSNPSKASASGNVWASTSNASLTTNVYQEGVDKLTEPLKGAPVVEQVVPAYESPDTSSVTSFNPDSIIAKIPAPPVFYAPSASTSSISFGFPVPSAGGVPQIVNVSWDASPYSSYITPLRLLLAGVFTITFFILFVRTFRSAFSS